MVMSSATSAGGNGGGTVMKPAASKDLPLAWDEGQKGSNGLQNAYRLLDYSRFNLCIHEHLSRFF